MRLRFQADAAGIARAAPRGRVLTHRARRRLHKQTKRTQKNRSWVDKFVDSGVRAYSKVWMKTVEPVSPGVERMLRRCGERIERTGRIDLRLLDRRFWEMLFVCGWWPYSADKPYWPQQWQRCRDKLSFEHFDAVDTIRQRQPSDEAAAETAAAYRSSPVVGSLYEWWRSLHAVVREQLKELSRALYDGKDAFSDRNRRNVRSRRALMS